MCDEGDFGNSTALAYLKGSPGSAMVPPVPSKFTATVKCDAEYKPSGVELFRPDNTSAGAMTKISDDLVGTSIWEKTDAVNAASGNWKATATLTLKDPTTKVSGVKTVP